MHGRHDSRSLNRVILAETVPVVPDWLLARHVTKQHRQDLRDLVRDQLIELESLADELQFPHVVEEVDQRIPESDDVGEHDRFLAMSDLQPRHLLDAFLEGADAAREGNKRVRLVEERLLALVHVLDDDELAASERTFAGAQRFWDDAQNLTTVIDNGIGDSTHEAVLSATVDEADLVLRQDLAEGTSCHHESRMLAGAGTAIDAD